MLSASQWLRAEDTSWLLKKTEKKPVKSELFGEWAVSRLAVLGSVETHGGRELPGFCGIQNAAIEIDYHVER